MFARPSLPSSTQRWAHGTSSIALMHTAMEDESVTAIEADIVMGSEIGNKNGFLTPILAHPPDRESDLSFRHFLNTSVRNGQLQKHLKLDFKEIEAVQPSLEILKTLVFERNEKIVFLNADILPGPGKTSSDITVPASQFLDQCKRVVLSMKTVNFAFSLGWKVDVCSLFGHKKHEITEMMSVIKESKLCDTGEVVLAVNARLLSKNMAPFEAFLDTYPEAQLLCWVGSGEPKIAKRKANRILQHFQRHGCGERIGFDVQTTNVVLGTFFDVIIWFIGLYKFSRLLIANSTGFGKIKST